MFTVCKIPGETLTSLPHLSDDLEGLGQICGILVQNISSCPKKRTAAPDVCCQGNRNINPASADLWSIRYVSPTIHVLRCETTAPEEPDGDDLWSGDTLLIEHIPTVT